MSRHWKALHSAADPPYDGREAICYDQVPRHGFEVSAYHIVMIAPTRSLTLIILATAVGAAYVRLRFQKRVSVEHDWEEEDRLAEIIKRAFPAIERARLVSPSPVP